MRHFLIPPETPAVAHSKISCPLCQLPYLRFPPPSRYHPNFTLPKSTKSTAYILPHLAYSNSSEFKYSKLQSQSAPTTSLLNISNGGYSSSHLRLSVRPSLSGGAVPHFWAAVPAALPACHAAATAVVSIREEPEEKSWYRSFFLADCYLQCIQDTFVNVLPYPMSLRFFFLFKIKEFECYLWVK